MAIKKTVSKKTTAPKKAVVSKKVKISPKKTAKKPTKKSTAKKKTAIKTGDVYECSVCGLSVTVDRPCGCADPCDIVCCGEPMTAE